MSVCFDTCHTHDSGYDVRNNFKGVIEEFDKVVGKEYISVFILMILKMLGFKKDRHENLGFGHVSLIV